MRKSILLIIIFTILTISFVSAVCTESLEANYISGQIATTEGSCDEAVEKNKAYTRTWRNSSGAIVEIDTGTTPNNIGENFFDTYIIPTDYTGSLNVTLTGINLEGNATTTVFAGSASDLIIANVTFNTDIFIGKAVAAHFDYCPLTYIEGTNWEITMSKVLGLESCDIDYEYEVEVYICQCPD